MKNGVLSNFTRSHRVRSGYEITFWDPYMCRYGGHVSLEFSGVRVFKRVFGMGFFSRRVTSAVSFCFSVHVSVVFFVSLRRISDQTE